MGKTAVAATIPDFAFLGKAIVSYAEVFFSRDGEGCIGMVKV